MGRDVFSSGLFGNGRGDDDQRNAAMVEEIANSSEVMDTQAKHLTEHIGRLSLDEGGD